MAENKPIDGELLDEDTQLIKVDGGSAIEAINRAEVDVQIATAHRFPRVLATVLAEAESLATSDEATAASMMYAVPREKKMIRGPSVRLAEVMASCWGNIRTATEVVDIGAEWVTVRAMCIDLQKNVALAAAVKRRITTKDGRRYSADMIQNTCNAAASIAYREAVFKVIPRAYANRIYEKARKVAAGDTKSLGERRQTMLDHFQKLGVNEKQVLAVIGKSLVDEIDVDALLDLRAIATAIREGETTVDAAFSPESARGAATSEKTKDLNTAIGAGAAPQGQQQQSETPPAEKTAEADPKSKQAPSNDFGDLSDVNEFVRKLAAFSDKPDDLAAVRVAATAAARNEGKQTLSKTNAMWRFGLMAAAKDGRFDFKLGVVRS
jgi:hypothetical protein